MFFVNSVKYVKAEDLSTRIYPFPQSSTVNSTLNFTLEIRIKYIYAMTSYQVYIDWDPLLLNLTKVTKGVFLSNSSQFPTNEVKVINNTAGTLRYGEYQFPALYEHGVGGNGTLFTLAFMVKGTGQCTIHLHDTIIQLAPSPTPLAHVVDDGYFNNQQLTYSDGGTNYNTTITSNSTAHDLSFNLTQKTISLNVSGPTGTTGYANITIPKGLLDVDPLQAPGVWVVFLDGVPTTSFTSTPNATHTFIYLTYTHSDHSIVIEGNKVIPEFVPNLYVLILMLSTIAVLPLLLHRRKHKP